MKHLSVTKLSCNEWSVLPIPSDTVKRTWIYRIFRTTNGPRTPKAFVLSRFPWFLQDKIQSIVQNLPCFLSPRIRSVNEHFKDVRAPPISISLYV